MLAQVPSIGERVTSYATAADYCNIFAEEMHSLFLLAFLLTADQDRAEQCFVGGLAECVERIGLSIGSARSWARRAIVKHAIGMVRPAPEKGANGLFVSAELPGDSGRSNPFAVILSLCAFERFVFIMSVLEGQSDEDCQSLLRCSRQEVVMAREVALKLIAAAYIGWEHTQVEKYTWPELSN